MSLRFVTFRYVSVENSVETAKCDSNLSMYCVHRSVDANVTRISKFLYKLYKLYIINYIYILIYINK